MKTKIITASIVVLSLIANVLDAQEIRKATESEISTYKEQLSKKTEEHRTDLTVNPSANTTNVAQSTPKAQEQTSAQKIEEKMALENTDKSIEYRELA